MLPWQRVASQNPTGQCNRAVIVVVGTFHPGVNLERRRGARTDAKSLHRILFKLGFKVDIHTDLSAKDIYQLFREESRRAVKDCFLSVLSSHGDEGCVYGADGEPVWLSRVFSCFHSDAMATKAKLFLIQACRGQEVDDGVEVDGPNEDSYGSVSLQLSVPADTAVMYASAPGYAAFMHPSGSVFLQTFCWLLEQEGNRELELTRLMTRLSHRVAYSFQARGPVLGGKKQMPCLLTRMTRDVYPFTRSGGKDGIEKGAGLSATSLLDSDVQRRRTPSIS